ncbi:MAG: hypothetical protein IT161_20660 [Bryobacterales bacterium]|nr:hypothetical protein [Bryobacterales bacterium]
MDRRDFLKTPASAVLATNLAAAREVTAEVKEWNGKPTLFVREQPVYASFYALTDCLGGRWTWDEMPRISMERFVKARFRLFQVDLFLEDVWTREGPIDVTLARKQIRGVLDLCPEAAVVIRWHLNAPKWWAERNPEEWTQYANGAIAPVERDGAVRIIMDDLQRTPRVSLASKVWREMATSKTVELLQALAGTPEGAALAGIHVACGVYGEWHYWGFIRNEPDTSRPMQEHFDAWRRNRSKAPVAVPGLAARAALDDGIFRDPQKREVVIDYYRCQHELVADLIVHFCRTVKRNWPRKILTGTFYGYFFSLFERQATGGHLCLQQVLAAPEVDYLSAPQAYGTLYRDMGGCGITRSLVESIRLHGKLFLDEMDQSPSWKWLNNVDTAFKLEDVSGDVALIRRNVLESYTRGMGLWYYDFGPANNSGWWLDRRLMSEIAKLKEILERYHQKLYQPAGDVLFVYDTSVFYYTGSTPGSDRMTDDAAVNRATAAAWQTSAAIETIHLADLPRVQLDRFKVVVFANTWLLTAEQRKFIRQRVAAEGRHVVFGGPAGYCDGRKLSASFVEQVTGIPGKRTGLEQHGNIWVSPAPVTETADWRRIFAAAGAHLYSDQNDVIHAGGGLVLPHFNTGGPRRLALRTGKVIGIDAPARSSLLFDASTGERLL